MSVDELIDKAKRLHEKGEYTHAILLLEGAHVERNYEVYNLLALSCWRNDEIQKAQYYNDIAYDFSPDSTIKKFHKGFGFFLAEDWKNVITELSDIYTPSVALWVLAKALAEEENWLRAERCLAQYYQIRPDPNALILRSTAYAKQNKLPEAIGMLTEYLKTNPAPQDRSVAYLRRGSLIYALEPENSNERKKAIQDITSHLDIDPTSIFGWKLRAEMLYWDREWQKALLDIKKALLLKPFDKDLLTYSSSIKSRLRLYEESIKDLEQTNGHANGLEPDFSIMMDIATNWRRLGKFEKALKDYKKILDEVNLDDEDRARLLFNRAGLYGEDLGDWPRALEGYKEAEGLATNKTNFKLFVANAQFNCGELDLAERLYNELPEEAEPITNLGSVYFQKGLEKEAWECFNRAVEMTELTANYVPLKNRAYYFQLARNWHASLQDLAKAKKLSGELLDLELDYRLDISKKQIHYESAYATISDGLTLKEELDKVIERILLASQSNALPPDASLVHYTNLPVAHALMEKERDDAFLWAGEVSYMNDPQEGKAFIEYLSQGSKFDSIRELLSDFETRKSDEDLKAFSISFNLQTKDRPASDELLLWRLYGRNEEGIEAGGCSLTFDSRFYQKPFRAEGDGGLSLDVKNKIFRLCEVKYLDPKEPDLDSLRDILERILTAISSTLSADKKVIEEHIFWNLIQVAYLFKTKHYEYEREVRLIHVRSLKSNPEEVKIFKPGYPGAAPRLYMEYNQRSVLRHLESIMLGPKSEQKERWKTYFKFKKKELGTEFIVDSSQINFS